ncbi:MAG TPA: CBS domain-containing protein [Lacipirellulaceae bacterium]|nr:CBS domain-containing protein [Lacipirellulaceae bacterium]
MPEFKAMPHERLEDLLVAHAMTRNVTVIPVDAVMAEAAKMLEEVGVSGAPVVDREGRCIGVVSAADFLRFHRDQAYRVMSRAKTDVGSEDGLPWDSVQRYMTVPVHYVSPAASLMDAAALMCVKHVHRLLVLDDAEAPVGLISTLDVVSAVVAAVDEVRQHRPSSARTSP